MFPNNNGFVNWTYRVKRLYSMVIILIRVTLPMI